MEREVLGAYEVVAEEHDAAECGEREEVGLSKATEHVVGEVGVRADEPGDEPLGTE